MHRSASTSRASVEFFLNMSPQAKSSPGLKSAEIDQLPTDDPLSEAAKKETLRLKSSERTVHIIPLVLILCAIILWFFSHPIEMVNKGDAIVSRIEGVTNDSHSNQTPLPKAIGPEEVDLTKHIKDDSLRKRSRESKA